MNYPKRVIVYHGCESGRFVVPGARPISLARFGAQIDALAARGWSFGNPVFIRAPVRWPTIYLTADDGLACFARTALPGLLKRGLPVHVAVCTGVWEDPPAWPLVHRVQIRCEMRDFPLVIADLPTEEAVRRPEWQAAWEAYAYEPDERVRTFKAMFNLWLPAGEADRRLGPVGAWEARCLAERFATPEALDGAVLGVHGRTHAAYGGDVEAYCTDEVEPCRQALVARGVEPSRIFTLPGRPRPGAHLGPLVDRLKDWGYIGMFDGAGEWDGESFVIPRIDAKRVEEAFDL